MALNQIQNSSKSWELTTSGNSANTVTIVRQRESEPQGSHQILTLETNKQTKFSKNSSLNSNHSTHKSKPIHLFFLVPLPLQCTVNFCEKKQSVSWLLIFCFVNCLTYSEKKIALVIKKTLFQNRGLKGQECYDILLSFGHSANVSTSDNNNKSLYDYQLIQKITTYCLLI